MKKKEQGAGEKIFIHASLHEWLIIQINSLPSAFVLRFAIQLFLFAFSILIPL